jgi:hypothetical protein
LAFTVPDEIFVETKLGIVPELAFTVPDEIFVETKFTKLDGPVIYKLPPVNPALDIIELAVKPPIRFAAPVTYNEPSVRPC